MAKKSNSSGETADSVTESESGAPVGPALWLPVITQPNLKPAIQACKGGW